jgi:hypothetical protein
MLSPDPALDGQLGVLSRVARVTMQMGLGDHGQRLAAAHGEDPQR